MSPTVARLPEPAPYKVQVYKSDRWLDVFWALEVTEAEGRAVIADLAAVGERARMVVR
jgi:hypothetical protein